MSKNPCTAEIIGIAMASDDYPMLAAAVLSHPSSRKMTKPAISAMAKVAFGKPGTKADHRLIIRSAQSILAFEVSP